MKTVTALLLVFIFLSTSIAQAPPSDLQQFIRVNSNVVALTHVRVIAVTSSRQNAKVDSMTTLVARFVRSVEYLWN